MPGPSVKNWAMYEDLRQKGFSKQSAARITNNSVKKQKAKAKAKRARTVRGGK